MTTSATENRPACFESTGCHRFGDGDAEKLPQVMGETVRPARASFKFGFRFEMSKSAPARMATCAARQTPRDARPSREALTELPARSFRVGRLIQPATVGLEE